MNAIATAVASKASTPSRAIWVIGLTVAILPVAFGVYQVAVYFDEAFPHLYWSRTLPAFGGVLLALAGIAVPIVLWTKRRAFCARSLARQWFTVGLLLVGMAALYLLPFTLLVDAARKTRAILPYTPAVYLNYADEADRFPLWFGVVGGPGTGHGGSRQNNDRIAIDWTAPLEPRPLGSPSDAAPTVRLRAETSLEADPITVEVEIETDREARFDIRGFRAATASLEGAPVALPMLLDAGRPYRITVQGRR